MSYARCSEENSDVYVFGNGTHYEVYLSGKKYAEFKSIKFLELVDLYAYLKNLSFLGVLVPDRCFSRIEKEMNEAT